MYTKTYVVEGMTCSHCEHAIVTELTEQLGLQSVSADAEGATVSVYSDTPFLDEDVIKAITGAGYSARLID